MSEYIGNDIPGLDAPNLETRIQAANHELSRYDATSLVPISIKETIEGSLDELWTLSGLDCVFSGLCRVTSQTEAGPGITEKDDYLIAARGINQGFWVTKYGHGEQIYWGVGIAFQNDAVHGENMDDIDEVENLQRYSQLYMVQPRVNYGIVPLHEIESSFPEGLNFLDNIYGLLSHVSDGLRDHLRSSEFLNQSYQDQIKAIEEALDAARQECLELHQDIQGVPIGLTAERAYVWNGGEGEERFVEIAPEASIKGTCIGLAVLAMHQLGLQKPIRETEQLCDAEAGLFLTVRPDTLTRYAANIGENEELYVPISGQNLEVLFDPSEIELM